jgi:hypothetical protein
VNVTFFVRYEVLLGDGEWTAREFGPVSDESAAHAFFEDQVYGTGPQVRNTEIVRREERVIQAQDGAAGG